MLRSMFIAFSLMVFANIVAAQNNGLISKNKNKLSLKQLVSESQTPGGINAQALKELKKKKFYKVQQKVLNSVFKRF